jgi:transcriptional regulator with XRE-family HTH domain
MFKDNLRRLREAKSLTRKQLAKILETTEYTIRDYENGKTEPDIKMLIKMADFFDRTLDELVGRPKRPVSEDKEKLIEIIDQLPEEKRRIAIEFFKTII